MNDTGEQITTTFSFSGWTNQNILISGWIWNIDGELRDLTLKFCWAQALLQTLHLALEESGVLHHVLRRVDLHGDFPGGRGGRDGLVELLLKNPAGEENGLLDWTLHKSWRSKCSERGQASTCRFSASSLSMRFHSRFTRASCSCSKVFSRSIFSCLSWKHTNIHRSVKNRMDGMCCNCIWGGSPVPESAVWRWCRSPVSWSSSSVCSPETPALVPGAAPARLSRVVTEHQTFSKKFCQNHHDTLWIKVSLIFCTVMEKICSQLHFCHESTSSHLWWIIVQSQTTVTMFQIITSGLCRQYFKALGTRLKAAQKVTSHIQSERQTHTWTNTIKSTPAAMGSILETVYFPLFKCCVASDLKSIKSWFLSQSQW